MRLSAFHGGAPHPPHHHTGMQQEICERCGSRILNPLSGESHHSAEEELAFITQALKLDDDLEKRAVLHRRLNDLQPSCRNLPSETLSIIFQFACVLTNTLDSFDSFRQQLNIAPLIGFGSVCSLWRQTAWSTPALWTTFVADVRLRTISSTTALLDLCLRNVGAREMPLHIDLRFAEEDLLPPHDPRLRSITKLIFNKKTARNVKVLHLRDPPPSWVSSWLAGMENLQDLLIDGVATSGSSRTLHITLPQLPSVHRLCIKRMQHPVTVPFADTVTTLELIEVTFGASIKILVQCRNLIECYFHPRDQLLAWWSQVNSNSPVTFYRLTHLSWPFSILPGGPVAFYRQMHLPALHQLRIICSGGSGPSDIDQTSRVFTAIKNFLDRLPPTLTVLEIERFHMDVWPLEQWLPFVPTSVKELVLINWGSDQSIPSLLRELIPKEGSAKVLPKLEKLCILPFMPKACWLLIEEMVQIRAEDGLNIPFKFVLPRPKDPQLKDAAERVEDLARVRGVPFVLEYLDSLQDPSWPAPTRRLRRSWSTEAVAMLR